MCVPNPEEPSKVNAAAQMGKWTGEEGKEKITSLNPIENGVSILLGDWELLVVFF